MNTKKKVNHPTGKFNCSPGPCVFVRFFLKVVYFRFTLLHFFPLITASFLSCSRIMCCSAEAGPQRVSPQALCAELHIGSAGDLLGAPQVVVQLPGGGAAEGQPAGVALLLSSGSFHQ